MAVYYIVGKVINGDWSVKRQGASSFRLLADNKSDAVKFGRVLSIKNNGYLVIVEHTINQQRQ